MTSPDRLALINRYLAAYNAFDVDAMLALLSPAIRFENYSGDRLTAAATGIDEFRQLAEQAKALFSEREQRITALVPGPSPGPSSGASPGPVIASIAYRGRLSADIPDGPRAGTVLELDGSSEFSFKDALIVKIVDRS